jgi:hypothetical protein
MDKVMLKRLQSKSQDIALLRTETILQSFQSQTIQTKKGLMNLHYMRNPRALSSKYKDLVFKLLYPIGLNALGHEDSEHAAEDIRTHLFSSNNLQVVTDPTHGNKTVAFQIWDILTLDSEDKANRVRVLYIAGICVHQNYQALGVGKALLTLLLKCEKDLYIAMFTQNPILKQTVDSLLGTPTYPNHTSTPKHIQSIAKRLASHMKLSKFDAETLVHARRYSTRLIHQRPSAIVDAVYVQLFNRLRYDEGDAFMCIGLQL